MSVVFERSFYANEEEIRTEHSFLLRTKMTFLVVGILNFNFSLLLKSLRSFCGIAYSFEYIYSCRLLICTGTEFGVPDMIPVSSFASNFSSTEEGSTSGGDHNTDSLITDFGESLMITEE